MVPFCYLCFVFSLSYCLVCFCQPCCHLMGKNWPLGFLVCDVSFPYGALGQVWYLIVSIPDLCLLPYFNNENHRQEYKYHRKHSQNCLSVENFILLSLK